MGKTTGVQDCNYHNMQEMYNGELQGDNLELAVLATGGGITQRRRPLLLSLALSHGCSHFTLSKWKTKKMSNNNKTVCPKSYLYSYDFRAIYRYSLEGSWKTYLQICPCIRWVLSPGLRHPDLSGYSSSGPCRVLLIRISPGLPASFIRFMPGLHRRFRTSHPEGP